MSFLGKLFGSSEPSLTQATTRDSAAISNLHAASFRRGWSEQEVEGLLADRTVLADRAAHGSDVIGFILSRVVDDEAEILSVAVRRSEAGRGTGRKLLMRHLARLAGLGVRAVFLEVEEANAPALKLYARAGFHEVARRPNYYPDTAGKPAANALVLRRDL